MQPVRQWGRASRGNSLDAACWWRPRPGAQRCSKSYSDAAEQVHWTGLDWPIWPCRSARGAMSPRAQVDYTSTLPRIHCRALEQRQQLRREVVSIPSTDSAGCGNCVAMPALLMRICSASSVRRSTSAARSTCDKSFRSRRTGLTCEGGTPVDCAMCCAAFAHLPSSRQPSSTVAPARAHWLATSRPSPVFAPRAPAAPERVAAVDGERESDGGEGEDERPAHRAG
eukprot:scaffold60459_cov31-Tisochrysis_lutea.AAC.2